MDGKQETIGSRMGFIGAGKMGAALIQGLLSSGLAEPGDLVASDVVEERTRLVADLGVRVARENGRVAEGADVIFLCVKPRDLAGVLEELRPHLTHDHLLISIAAGVRLSFLEARVPAGVRVVRVMPNLPAVVREVAAAYALGAHATADDARLVERIFGSLGVCVRVEEAQLDAVTGLSGSGPAYAYAILEGLIQGAVEAGLTESTARLLAAQTLRGAATLALREDQDLADLIREVATPGGTTVEGLRVMDEGRVREVLSRAVVAASRRAGELAKG